LVVIEESRTYERQHISRFIPAPAREVLLPADQVAHLDLERPLLAQAVGPQPVAVDEGFVLAEFVDELLQVGDGLGVLGVGVAPSSRATAHIGAVDGNGVDRLQKEWVSTVARVESEEECVHLGRMRSSCVVEEESSEEMEERELR
jgi:hypothetical protein